MVVIIVNDAEMSVEEIAWKYRQSLYPYDADKAAALSGYVERIYDLNAGLAALGQLIPVGTKIDMPEEVEASASSPNRLWG